MERFKSELSINSWSTEVETHLSIKFSKKNFGGILSTKSVRRSLVIVLMYGPIANKQFDIAFSVFPFPGPLRQSQSMRKPGPSDIVIYRADPWHFLLCKSPGAGHKFQCKSLGVPPPPGGGNRSK